MFLLFYLIVIISYFFTILWFRSHWLSYKKQKTKTLRPKPFVSIVIAFKNEWETLPVLLSHLHNQFFPKNSFEIIIVNDHSTDGNYECLVKHNVKLMHSSNHGKKAALHQGITAAKGQFIITTDADCLLPPTWIETMIKGYQFSSASMIIGPVNLNQDKSTFFHGFEFMDFIALQLSGGGAAIGNRPLFCNGANLGFMKESWLKAIEVQDGSDFASGDDVFLLHAFKKLGLKTLYLKEKNAIVKTQPAGSWQQFFRQRIRWGGKSKSYNDVETLLLAFLVFLTNLMLVLAPLSLAWSSSFWMALVVGFLLKFTADIVLLKSGESFFNFKLSWLTFFLYSILYPFYIVYTALAGFFCKEKW
ncbi:MAG TPA: glycosyltransferase [Marinilabiliaceae bacterium]|nr:glycosyltransferase [Marinilabiliaceae bacterium]